MRSPEQAIEAGLRFLGHQQQSDGSFLSYSSPTEAPFKEKATYHSPFPAALILSCLTYVPQSKEIRDKTAAFLLYQQGKMGSWNYWTRQSQEYKDKPYPDDLDDTFCSLTALVSHDPTLLSSELLTVVAKLLVQAESQVGGPYYTWLVGAGSSDHWKDIDVAVNSNVARFLKETGANVPPLREYLEKRVKENKLSSPYYPSSIMTSWFLAHCVEEGRATVLQRRLLKQLQPGQSPLTVALLLSSLLMLGEEHAKLVWARDFLIKQQKASGGWQSEAFCLDPAKEGKAWYAGSSALTTALCLQALAQFQMAERLAIQNKVREQVVKEVEKGLASLTKSAQPLLEKVRRIDTRLPILTFPFVVQEAAGQKVKNDLMVRLGAASTFGWMAYTFLDDLLDIDTPPDKPMVPVATMSLARMIWLFQDALPDNPAFQTLVRQIIVKINEANAWEAAHCFIPRPQRYITINSLPEYKNNQVLADRSLGHALAGVGILLAIGKPNAVKPFLTFCTHFLIARQLSDDALDWEEDMRAGHINSVAAQLIQPSDLKKKQETEAFITKLRKRFNSQVVKEAIKRQVQLGNKALQKADLQNPELLTDLAKGLLKRS